MTLPPLPQSEHPLVRYIWEKLSASLGDVTTAAARDAAVEAAKSTGKTVPAIGVAMLPAVAVIGAAVDLQFTWSVPLAASYQWAVLTQPPTVPSVVQFTEKARTLTGITLTAKALAAVAGGQPVVALGWNT